jgi:integrase
MVRQPQRVVPCCTTHQPFAREENPPKMRIHDLRHTAGSLLLAQGIHPKVVQEMLGHSQISMTMDVSSHVQPHLGQEAAEKMNAILRA